MSEIRMNYQDYLNSDYWKQVSQAVKKRAGYRCQICNSQHDLQAHHRCYDHRGNELQHLDDLTCLCRRCHAIFHGKIQEQPVVVSTTVKVEQPKSSHGMTWEELFQKPKKKVANPVIVSLPTDDPITLTYELVMACRTARGGWTSATIRAFNVPLPLLSGWPKRLIGSQISKEAYQRALEGRTVYHHRFRQA